MDMISIRNGQYERDGFSLTMDFAIVPATITAVLGPSGAGKSTLLNLLAGFEVLQDGEVFLNGVDCLEMHPSIRPVNFVFQDNNSFAHLNARQNVALGIAPSLKLSAGQWVQVDEALSQVGIAALALRKPGEMSGGEKQRIALARVLVREKPILLLDEAFAALGPALRQDMLLLLKRIQEQKQLTVLMVTHQPQDARLIADQVLFVSHHHVNQPMKVSAFFKSKDPEIREYLGR